jgi:hypothetical protein
MSPMQPMPPRADHVKPIKWLSLAALASGLSGVYHFLHNVWVFTDNDVWNYLEALDYANLGVGLFMGLLWLYIGILLYNWSWK